MYMLFSGCWVSDDDMVTDTHHILHVPKSFTVRYLSKLDCVKIWNLIFKYEWISFSFVSPLYTHCFDSVSSPVISLDGW